MYLKTQEQEWVTVVVDVVSEQHKFRKMGSCACPQLRGANEGAVHFGDSDNSLNNSLHILLLPNYNVLWSGRE